MQLERGRCGWRGVAGSGSRRKGEERGKETVAGAVAGRDWQMGLQVCVARNFCIPFRLWQGLCGLPPRRLRPGVCVRMEGEGGSSLAHVTRKSREKKRKEKKKGGKKRKEGKKEKKRGKENKEKKRKGKGGKAKKKEKKKKKKEKKAGGGGDTS